MRPGKCLRLASQLNCGSVAANPGLLCYASILLKQACRRIYEHEWLWYGRETQAESTLHHAQQLDSGWLELSPVAPLERGEYAIVSLPGSARFFSEYAYDFGVDPALTAPIGGQIC
jgi:hypothetical protein